MTYLLPPTSTKGIGISNILVITDHFTKYALAIPTRDQAEKTTAEALYKNFIVRYCIKTYKHNLIAMFQPTQIHVQCINKAIQVLLMHGFCGFTNKHSGAVIKTDVVISKGTYFCIFICPGSGIFKTFAGNVLFLAIIDTGKKNILKQLFQSFPNLFFRYINICWAPREVLKPSPLRLGIQHLPLPPTPTPRGC